MTKAVLKQINKVYDALQAKLLRETDRSSMFGRGLATEGFAGGYLAALRDVDAALRGNPPSTHPYPELWKAAKQTKGTL